jgi:cytochrome c553
VFLAMAAAAEHRAAVQADWDFQHRMLVSTDKRSGALGLRQDQQPAPLADEQAGVLAGDRDPTDLVARRVDALLSYLAAKYPERPCWTGYRQVLDPLLVRARSGTPDLTGKDPSRQETYRALCALRREIAMANPLLDFDTVLLSEESNVGGCLQRATTGQYNGLGSTEPGGGLYLVGGWKGANPAVANLCEGATVENGPHKGRTLSGGTFHAPSLTHDGKFVLFSWAKLHYPEWPATKDEAQHPDTRAKKADALAIFRIGVDGKGLRQLTVGGPHNDTEPCELPDGRIAFMSTRREVYDRCSAYRPAFTLCSMKPDGSDILLLSRHETHEWLPSVSNDGMVLYTRWDYVDRQVDASHGIWVCCPDGRDARAPSGNYMGRIFTSDAPGFARYNPQNPPRPFDFAVMRAVRQPMAVSHIHAIPGSHRVMAIGSSHHVTEAGQVMLLDLHQLDDYAGSQVVALTPGPWGEDQRSEWSSPWPLSEDFFLANYLDRVYLVDRFGNWELVHRSPSAHHRNFLRCYSRTEARKLTDNEDPLLIDGRGVTWRPSFPQPVRARPRPPAVPPQTFQSEDRRGTPGHVPATIAIANVYDTDVPLPKDVRIKRLRLVQVLGCSSGSYGTVHGGDNSAVKLPLGTVPVEQDGSVYCLAPVDKGFYFQLLDEDGLAVHSMLSLTYAHAGERLSCGGCHEPYGRAQPKSGAAPLAFQRPPCPLTQESPDGRLRQIDDYVRPAVDRVFVGCVACHEAKGKGPRGPRLAGTAREASSLRYQVGHPMVGAMNAVLDKAKGDAPFGKGWIWTYGGNVLNATRGRTTPDQFGARGSGIWQHLQKNQGEIRGLHRDDLRLFALWLDLLCVSSSNWGKHRTVTDAAGVLLPLHPDLDIANPVGTEDLSDLSTRSSAALAEEAASATGSRKAFLLETLARRRPGEYLGLYVAAVSDPSDLVRHCVLRVVAQFGDATAVPPLVAAAARAETRAAAEGYVLPAEAVCSRIADKPAVSAILAAAIPGATVAGKYTLLRMLARMDTERAGPVARAVLAGLAPGPANLAMCAQVSATGKALRDVRFAVDGHVPALCSQDDYYAAWAVRGASGQTVSFCLKWDQPVEVAELLYYGRTAWSLQECWKDYELYLDGGAVPVAKGAFAAMQGPQRIQLDKPTRTGGLTLRFLTSHGGANPGASEVRVLSVPIASPQDADWDVVDLRGVAMAVLAELRAKQGIPGAGR